jgi:DNA-directed RNA polymerase subunit beta'
LFEVRSPKGVAYLAEIPGKITVAEGQNNYVLTITNEHAKPAKLQLGERIAKVKTGDKVAIGDVVAELDGGEGPLVSPVAGKVTVNVRSIAIKPEGSDIETLEIPSFKQVLVKTGDEVVAGQRLTNGSINLHDLMRLQGVEATQRYIMNEILKIFISQGQNIADKHLEIIVRQMFNRVQVEDAGDSEFVTGDIVSKISVAKVNEKLKAGKKKPVIFNRLLLGITKASLSTDSFLSAASFQDTTRVLISAATSGKVDELYGLKENVILGRKIPVGTGAIEEEPATEVEK